MSEVDYDYERKQDFIKGLRDLANWLEVTPSATVPNQQTVFAFLDSKEDAKQLAREAGNIEKHYIGNYLYMKKKFGYVVRYEAAVSRNTVCTRKVVGTELKEVPDYSNVPKVKKEVEVVEWECDPLLKPEA